MKNNLKLGQELKGGKHKIDEQEREGYSQSSHRAYIENKSLYIAQGKGERSPKKILRGKLRREIEFARFWAAFARIGEAFARS